MGNCFRVMLELLSSKLYILHNVLRVLKKMNIKNIHSEKTMQALKKMMLYDLGVNVFLGVELRDISHNFSFELKWVF